MSEHWKEPEDGDHFVAILSQVYEALTDEIDNFIGRPLAMQTHYYTASVRPTQCSRSGQQDAHSLHVSV